ncbi:helix-turn-helix domain-containing protein [Streptomyces sp. NPDC007162]|uniref:TetR/AcrR family transcriptional regulator n=1 Tax=Streptomyces sp. NPDC007162 TaxID=3156917 RepID=UPI0033C8B02A
MENRRRAVAAASQLFRERGVNGISVADLMKSIGLTTGGFYKQFPSKEALIAEAAQAAFGDMAREPTAGEVRETFAAGVEEFAAWMSTDSTDGLPVVATLVGAILLARATAGTEPSEQIMEPTHKALTAPQEL